jgi:hypothetical protein
MDTLSFHYNVSIFSKWIKYEDFTNPQKSWVNKYKFNNPTLGPKFFGSKTFLVWTTDLWHLSKTLMITFFALAIVFYTPLITTGYILLDLFINAEILHISFSLTFGLFWDRILKLKK